MPQKTKSRGTKTANSVWAGAPEGAHEWVSFPDPDYERTWMFDVTFLESGWTCIYGRGCQGVLTGPAPELEQGCCSYGAHLTGGKDARRVQAAAATLTREQWQFFDRARQANSKKLQILRHNKAGDLTTRLVKEACIFLNRPGFPGGAGCALHRAALERGVPPLELKPDVCWQLPLRRDDETAEGGHVTSVIRQWDRRDWGKGGEEFHWWCTESPDAFVGGRPVYEEMYDELEELVGKKIFRRLLEFLRAREQAKTNGSTTPRPVPLPHPAIRKS